MKKIICLIFALIIKSTSGQTLPQEHEWTATIKAVDEAGQPVTGAKVSVGYDMTSNAISGLTDKNGVFIASHHDATENLSINAEKLGCYAFSMTYHKGTYSPDTWNPILIIAVKRIIKPIPMYAKHVRTHVPDLNKSVGYDLMVGDWVAPYGRGINADFLFMAHFETNNDESDFTLTVSFPNQGDGIQEFSAPIYYLGSRGSVLRSNEEAPKDGYQSKWIQTDNRKVRGPLKTNRDLNRNYYFRVRTKMDDHGNIVSAHYGKIYGDFMQFSYYFNPTPNSRNLEFDPKQNLMTNLKFTEGVSQP